MTGIQKIVAASIVSAALAAGGCASDDMREIPTTAVQVGDTRGDLAVTAPQDGMIYIYDESNGQLVYSGQVNAGDLVKLDTEEEDITINGRKAASNALIDDHRHKVFFEKMPTRTIIERRTTVLEPLSGRTTIVTPDEGSKTTVVTPDADATDRTTIIGPDGRRTTVVTPAPEEQRETIITTPSR